MKKQKLKFFIVNLFAVSGLAISAFLPWLDNNIPKDVSLERILPFALPAEISSMYASVAAIILAGSVFVLIGAIFCLKSTVVFGIALNISLAIFWFMDFGVSIEKYNYGGGYGLFIVSLSLALLSLLIPRRNRERNR